MEPLFNERKRSEEQDEKTPCFENERKAYDSKLLFNRAIDFKAEIEPKVVKNTLPSVDTTTGNLTTETDVRAPPPSNKILPLIKRRKPLTLDIESIHKRQKKD